MEIIMNIISAIRELCKGESGFVVDDHEVGKTKCFSGEDEYYDDGIKLGVK